MHIYSVDGPQVRSSPPKDIDAHPAWHQGMLYFLSVEPDILSHSCTQDRVSCLWDKRQE